MLTGKARTLHACARACRGAGLLEALIALAIFSIGVLGLIGLQARAMIGSRDAQYRAEAAVLAQELIGIAWTDRANLAQYAHNATGTTACAPQTAVTSNVNAQRWLAQFTTTTGSHFLPGATSEAQQIAVDVNGTIRVTICWRAPQDTGWARYTKVARVAA